MTRIGFESIELVLSRHEAFWTGNGPANQLVAGALSPDWLVVQYLLEKGVNVNITDDHGWTALMAASYGDDPKLVDWLLAKGADPHQTLRGGSPYNLLGDGLTACMCLSFIDTHVLTISSALCRESPLTRVNKTPSTSRPGRQRSNQKGCHSFPSNMD